MALLELVAGQPFPLAEVDLAQLGQRHRLPAEALGERLRSLTATCQIAAVKAGPAPAGEPFGKPLRLLAAALRKRRIELSLDLPEAVPGRLRVAREDQSGGGGPGGLGGVGRGRGPARS